MSYLGAYIDGGIVRFTFNTWDKANGAPITFAGTPSLTSYKDGGLTQVATGITLTVDFDGVTGLHLVAIDTTADAHWAAGSEYAITVAAGTVDGVSMVGRVVGQLSLTNGGLPTQSKADVNAEVVDGLATDTYTEPGQGAPVATATLAAKINYLYKAFRNRKAQTATLWSLYADDQATVDQKATVSDDGTTAIKQEIVSGP